MRVSGSQNHGVAMASVLGTAAQGRARTWRSQERARWVWSTALQGSLHKEGRTGRSYGWLRRSHRRPVATPAARDSGTVGVRRYSPVGLGEDGLGAVASWRRDEPGQCRQNSSVAGVDRGAGSTKLWRRWSSSSSRLRVWRRRLDVEVPAALLLHLAADGVELLLLSSFSSSPPLPPLLLSVLGEGGGAQGKAGLGFKAAAKGVL